MCLDQETREAKVIQKLFKKLIFLGKLKQTSWEKIQTLWRLNLHLIIYIFLLKIYFELRKQGHNLYRFSKTS